MWALASILYRLGLHQINVFKANLLRSLAALLFLLALTAALNLWNWIAILLSPLALYAIGSGYIGLGIGDCCYFACIRRIGVSRATPLAYSYPFFVIVLAVLTLNEPLTLEVCLGTLLIVIGVYFVSSTTAEVSSKTFDLRGVLYGISTSFLWALSIYILKLASEQANFIEFNTARLLLLIPFLLALNMVFKEPFSKLQPLTKREAVFLALGGVLALGIGDLMLIYSLSIGQASLVAPLSATQPLFAILLALLILRERISKKLIIGAVLVVLGAALLIVV